MSLVHGSSRLLGLQHGERLAWWKYQDAIVLTNLASERLALDPNNTDAEEFLIEAKENEKAARINWTGVYDSLCRCMRGEEE